MTEEEAFRILGLDSDACFPEVRRRFRKLMLVYHPDSARAERSGALRQAQEISEAYRLLKKRMAGQGERRVFPDSAEPSVPVNPEAVCERNIYRYYSMDLSEEGIPPESLFYRAGRGKYYWNPEEEDFRLFLRSLQEASRSLLMDVVPDHPDAETFFRYQVRVFEELTGQFVRPERAIRRILKPEQVDPEGREIYRMTGFLNAADSGERFREIRKLRAGDPLYPAAMPERKIVVRNGSRISLGVLELQNDALYLCIVPLLRERLAQIRMEVDSVRQDRRRRPFTVSARIDVQVRIPAGAASSGGEGAPSRIRSILQEYRKECISLRGQGDSRVLE